MNHPCQYKQRRKAARSALRRRAKFTAADLAGGAITRERYRLPEGEMVELGQRLADDLVARSEIRRIPNTGFYEWAAPMT